MNREVEINIPMFIAIILIIAVITSILVYGINTFINRARETGNETSSTLQQIENLLNKDNIILQNNINGNNFIKNM